MRKNTIYGVMYIALILGMLEVHFAWSMEDAPEAEQRIEKILESHSQIKQLVVGCGNEPYAWQPESAQGVNRWQNDEDKGDHTHANCLTLAEILAVKPTILWDWTKPVPKCMHNRFAVIYLEKLPPRVLEQDSCMQNLYNCLVAGGQYVFDHQVYNIVGQSYSIQSPFCIMVPLPSQEFQGKVDSLQTLFNQQNEDFLTTAGLEKDAPMDSEKFEKLLSNPKLFSLQMSAMGTRRQIDSLTKSFLEAQSLEMMKLKAEMYQQAKRKLKETYGFSTASHKENMPNPYNKRKQSTLMWGKKPL
jgi:hypothetical protein